MKKRILSLLLAFLMLVSISPVFTYAEDGAEPDPIPTEAPTASPCPTCSAIDCDKEHKVCDKCSTVDCTADHSNWCEICKVDNCGKTHIAQLDESASGPACNCSAAEGEAHAATCPAYTCPDCGAAGWHESCPEGQEPDETPTEPEVCAKCGETPCTCEDEGQQSPDYSGDIGKYAVLNRNLSTYTAYVTYEFPYYPEDFTDDTVFTISNWRWDAEKNQLWYQLELVRGSTQGDFGYWTPGTWILQNGSNGNSLIFVSRCGACGEFNCAKEHKWCEVCEDYDCGKDHTTTEPEAPGLSHPESGIVISGTTFPEDVKVSVSPADVGALFGRYDIPVSDKVFGLDISLIQDGEDYQPGTSVKVKVPVEATAGTKIGLIHNHNGAVSLMGMTEVRSDGTVEFYTDRFSEFAGFTVDFDYNGNDYSIAGLTSIKLSELFVALEIDRDAAKVIDVTFSDTSLVSVTKLDGDWQLESLQAFDTEETLTITFYDGEIITIVVTDDAYPQRDKFKNHNSANDAYRNGEGTSTARPYKAFSAVPGVNCNWSVWGGGNHVIYVYLYDTAGNPVDYSYFDEHPQTGGYLGFSGNYWYEVTDYYFSVGKPSRIGTNTLSMGDCGWPNIWPGPTINWVEVRMYSLDVWDNKSYCDVNQVSKFARDESGETGNRTVVIYAENNEVGRTSVYMPTFESISTSDLTVSPYAGWTHEKTTVSGSTYSVYLKRVSYTISYTLNGGTVSPANPTSYNVETPNFTLNNPTKTGYNFDGWTGTGLSDKTLNVTIPKGSTGARSYTANWNPVDYIITYDLVGGSPPNGVTSNQQTYNVTQALELMAKPTKEGYKFTGWKLNESVGSWVNDTYEAKQAIAAGQYGDITLVAQWERYDQYRYVLSFDANTTDQVRNMPNPIDTGWIDDDKYSVDLSASPTRDNYDFMGWAASPDATADQVLSEYTMEGKANDTVSGKLYAVWQRQTGDLKLRFNGNDSSPAIVTVSGQGLKITLLLTKEETLKDLPTGSYTVTAQSGNASYTASVSNSEPQVEKEQTTVVDITIGSKGLSWFTAFFRVKNKCS